MGAAIIVNVYGVKEALKELKQTDPTFRKEFPKAAKRIALPVTNAQKASYPPKLLSGMARNWVSSERPLFPYSQAAAVKGVKVFTETGKRNQSVLSIVQMDVAAAVIDMAGKADIALPLGNRLTDKLGSHASRVMWPGYEKHANEIENGFRDLVADVMKRVGKKIAGV